MSRRLRWGDFDMQAWKWLKKDMLGESDPYTNGKRYDEGIDWRRRYELETLDEALTASS